MSLLHYQDNIFRVASDLDLQPSSGYTVATLAPGAIAASDGVFTPAHVSGGHLTPAQTVFTVQSGHGLTNGRIQLNTDANVRTDIGSVTGNTITVDGNFPVMTGDTIVSLNTVTVYTDMAGTVAVTEVTTDEGGNYEYWHSGLAAIWEMVSDGAGTPVAIVNGTFSPGSVLDASKAPGSDFSAKVINTITALPSTGGVVDARGLTGAQTSSTNPFAGVTKRVELLLGAATITTSEQWAIPNRCIIRGVGRDTTTLIASSTFPTSTPLVRLGQGLETIGTVGNRIENMTLDCNNIAGSTGIYSTEINELCGGKDLLIQKFMTAGIWMASSGTQKPDNYLFDNIEMYSASAATAADAIYVGSGVGSLGVFRRITIVNLGNVTIQPRGVYISTGARLQHLHIENATNGVYFDTNAIGSVSSASMAVAGTTLVRIIGSGAITLTDLNKGPATNVVKNDYLGSTIVDAVLPLYTTSHTTGGYQAYYMGARDYTTTGAANVEALDSPVWVIKSKATSGGAAVSAIHFLDGNNTGFAIRISDAAPGFFSIQPVTAGVIGTAIWQIRTDGILTTGVQFGDASTDVFTYVGRMVVRTVSVDPSASATAGTIGEVVYSSNTAKFYGKHTTSASDTNWRLMGT